VTVLAFLMLLDFAPARIATAPLTCAPRLDVLARYNSTFGVLDLPAAIWKSTATWRRRPVMAAPSRRASSPASWTPA